MNFLDKIKNAFKTPIPPPQKINEVVEEEQVRNIITAIGEKLNSIIKKKE